VISVARLAARANGKSTHLRAVVRLFAGFLTGIFTAARAISFRWLFRRRPEAGRKVSGSRLIWIGIVRGASGFSIDGLMHDPNET
jgi:hypothetical protein